MTRNELELFYKNLKEDDKERELYLEAIDSDAGTIYGDLKLIGVDHRRIDYWNINTLPWEDYKVPVIVQCTCDNKIQFSVEYGDLVNGLVTDCGTCNYSEADLIDFNTIRKDTIIPDKGMVQGRLTVVGIDISTTVRVRSFTTKEIYKKGIYMRCLCTCGKLKSINTQHLKGTLKSINSCGCLHKDVLRKDGDKNDNIVKFIDDYVVVTVSTGEEVFIDADDYKRYSNILSRKISVYTEIDEKNNRELKYASVPVRGESIGIHRIVTRAGKGVIVDHYRNSLDNRKLNLNSRDNSFNSRNRKLYSTNTTGCAGVRTSFYGNYLTYMPYEPGAEDTLIGSFKDLDYAIYARLVMERLAYGVASGSRDLMVEYDIIETYDDLDIETLSRQELETQALKLRIQYILEFPEDFRGIYRGKNDTWVVSYSKDNKGYTIPNIKTKDEAIHMRLQKELEYYHSDKCQVWHLLKYGYIKDVKELLDRNIDEEILGIPRIIKSDPKRKIDESIKLMIVDQLIEDPLKTPKQILFDMEIEIIDKNISVVNHVKEYIKKGLYDYYLPEDLTGEELMNVTGKRVRYKGEGYRHNNAIYTDDQIHTICMLLEEGYTNVEIVESLGVSRGIVTKIKTGEAWTHISKHYNIVGNEEILSGQRTKDVRTKAARDIIAHIDLGYNPGSRYNTENQIHAVCLLLEQDCFTIPVISEVTHVSKDAIGKIKSGKNSVHISRQYNIPKTKPNNNVRVFSKEDRQNFANKLKENPDLDPKARLQLIGLEETNANRMFVVRILKDIELGLL